MRKLKMSFFSRLRLLSHRGFFRKPLLPCGHYLVRSVMINRGFALPALKEEEVEEIEIDQRRLPADYDPATFDPIKHRCPPTNRVWQLVDEISSLKLVELHDLKQILTRKMNIKEDPVVAVMKPGAAGLAATAMKGSTAAAKEEKKVAKTIFELKLESFDSASKVKVIKEVRTFTNLGLKEERELMEKAPAVFKKGVSEKEGEKIIEKMKAVGAKVILE